MNNFQKSVVTSSCQNHDSLFMFVVFYFLKLGLICWVFSLFRVSGIVLIQHNTTDDLFRFRLALPSADLAAQIKGWWQLTPIPGCLVPFSCDYLRSGIFSPYLLDIRHQIVIVHHNQYTPYHIQLSRISPSAPIHTILFSAIMLHQIQTTGSFFPSCLSY